MRNEVLCDPLWLSEVDGDLAAKALHKDSYFEPEPYDSALGLVLDQIVKTLPAQEQECVRLHVYEKLSYAQIAEEMGWWCGDPAYLDKKRAWRSTRSGLAKIKREIGNREWISALTPKPEILGD